MSIKQQTINNLLLGKRDAWSNKPTQRKFFKRNSQQECDQVLQINQENKRFSKGRDKNLAKCYKLKDRPNILPRIFRKSKQKVVCQTTNASSNNS